MSKFVGIENVTSIPLLIGTKNLHSFILANNKIYGGTRQEIARIVELSNGVVSTKVLPSTVNPITMFDDDYVYQNIENMAYHEASGHCFANCHNTAYGDTIRVIEFYNDGTEIVYSDVISESWNFIVETKPTIAVIVIDQANNYLYGITWGSVNSTEETTVRRYDLMDKDESGLLTLLNEYIIPLNSMWGVHSATIDGNYLYLTNQQDSPYVVKVNINGDMSLVDSVRLPEGYNLITDDSAIFNNRLWVGLEAGTHRGAMVGLSVNDLSDMVFIDFPDDVNCYGIFAINDSLYAVHYSTMPIISKINDEALGLDTYLIPAIAAGINELIYLNGLFYAPTWVGSETTDSVILEIDLIDGTISTTISTSEAPMIDYELSTLYSIARHEAEINNLAQKYTRKALSVASTVQMTAVPDTITAITAVKSDNTTLALTKGATTWALPLGEYVRFICATGDDYFSLLEGTGSIITSAGGNYTLALANTPSWTDAEITDDWQPKITLANEMIYNKIYTSLSSRVSTDLISDVIADIENPEILSLASDYKTLELIYMDLYGKIGTAELIQAKIEFYRQQFEIEFKNAFNALDFGDYGYLFTNTMGRIVR